MKSWNLCASTWMACVLAVGFLGIAPLADATADGKSAKKPRESARNYVLESKRRGQHRARAPRIHLPIGPSYIYYDYPYYYSRGYYPTHIVRYVYYNPNAYYDRNYRRSLRRHKARRN